MLDHERNDRKDYEMPSLDTLRKAYEQQLPHDSAPEQCASCPNLEVSHSELGRREMGCRLVSLLMRGVANYERVGGWSTEATSTPVTAGHIFTLVNSELQPFHDENADQERIAYGNEELRKYPKGRWAADHPRGTEDVQPIHEVRVDYRKHGNDYEEDKQVKLGNHLINVLKKEHRASVGVGRTDVIAELYPATLVEAITDSPENCPVIVDILSQATAAGITSGTEVKVNDPIQHRSPYM